MKLVFATLLLLSCQAFAYDHIFYGDVDEYDADSGQYYSVVTERQEKTGLLSSGEVQHGVNLFIYDPVKKAGRNLFDKSVGYIDAVIIESDYDSKERRMTFVGGGDKIRNNKNIEPRKPSSALIVETFDTNKKEFTVWKAEKAGGEPKALFAYAQPAKWHVDEKAHVVRLLRRTGNTYSVSEYAW